MDNTLESPRPVFGVRECLMLPAALCLGSPLLLFYKFELRAVH